MNFDLLSQNLLLVLCSFVSTALVFLLSKVIWPPYIPDEQPKKRGRPKKTEAKKTSKRILKRKRLGLLVLVSLLLAFAMHIAVAYSTDSKLPPGFIFMLLPATVSLVTLALILRSYIQLWGLALACMVCSILFSLLLINNYYRFYPTLGEVFNQNGALALSKAQTKVIVRHSSPTVHGKVANKPSVEGALDAVANEMTNGKVYSVDIPGKVSHFHARTAYVYVPSVYSTDTNIRLPVIVLMPGFPGLPENWLGSGLQATMDNFAKQHGGITPIVFMVDNTGALTNDTECVDSPRGNAETYLSVDVPAYIKSHFDVETDPSHWAIGGLSLGGTCSIMLALRHPNVYHYFIDLGGEIGPEIGSEQQTTDMLFDGSTAAWQAHQPEYLLANRSYRNLGMGGFFGDGKQDTPDITEAAAELSHDSQEAGIETVYETINGQHTFDVWQQTFKLALPWVSNRIGATECRDSCL